jgi:hypothetical protein
VKVRKGDDEGDVREDDGRGRVVGAEMAGGPQARDGERREIVDRSPHATNYCVDGLKEIVFLNGAFMLI